MKKTILVLIFSLSTRLVFSQFDALYSQYMLNKAAFNPAAIAQSGMIDITGVYRLNWLNFTGGGGSTGFFSINSPLKIGGVDQGIGVSLMKDIFGGFTNQAFNFQYAYKKNVGIGKLSIGANIGFVDIGFNVDSLNAHKITIGDYYNISSDPAIPTTNVNGMGLNLDFGLWYSTDLWYGGLSYLHLNNPTVKWGSTNEFTEYSSLYLTGGYNYNLEDRKMKLKPSFLFKTDFSTWQLDLSSLLDLNDKYWVGLSYRVLDAVVLMGGINIANGLSIGYSFDISTNKLISTNYGSHEIVLKYSFEYLTNKSTAKYKSIRFL